MQIPVVYTEDYNYSLPQEKIAQHPLAERDSSKLLVFREGVCETTFYRQIADYLPENSLVVFNNSKVIPARILYVKETSGVIELFCLEPLTGTPYEALQQHSTSIWTCMIGGLKKWRKGSELQWHLKQTDCIVNASLTGQNENGFEVSFEWTDPDLTFADILQQLGQMPIPPYLLRKADQEDAERYQTVYATIEGSVAAPTAGLHFTSQIISSLKQKNIDLAYTTLHVGAGTFKPVNAALARDHVMHAEWVEISREFVDQLSSSNQIICVGTTSLRTVESLYWYALHCIEEQALLSHDYVLPQFIAYENEEHVPKDIVFTKFHELLLKEHVERILFKTELMILPGYSMRVASRLVTNFHQPKSTLLMLVNAFTKGKWKCVYEYALKNDYRFLSYGDGCLLEWEEK